ncbi:helix-turn-helix domain-containing protein [Zafaria sp. J156]|uniref:helix-turn-helix domain-containing protein n=1 Tax=Zafaria sp. J156 TaxID=3116490 RepID=UPI002E788FF2|nr:helix-turn-helix transcriptional regulator [Zafaria sp. J156]MEE1621393.1 helix-turn-helix transcriptional regulator [Zafaria sp. J156]
MPATTPERTSDAPSAADGSGFAATLRRLRIERGLTQSQLAGDAYTASYVSLLESGRRRPRPDIVAGLAARLGVDASELSGRSLPGPDKVRLVQLELLSRQQLAAGDLDGAFRTAEAALEGSGASEDPAWWFSHAFGAAEAALGLRRFEDFDRLLDQLLDHPVTGHAAALESRCRSLLAQGRLARGELPDAADAARAALDLALLDPVDPEALAVAIGSLTSALAEGDDLELAAAACAEYGRLDLDVLSTRSRANAWWTQGNIAFLHSDPARGVELHDAALGLLSPATGLRQWGQLNRATVARRLAAGVHDDSLGAHLRRARLAFELLDSKVELEQLAVTEAQWLLAAGRPAEALAALEAALPGLTELPTQTVAEAHLAHADALAALDLDPGEALLAAAQGFEAAGAFDRASAAYKRYVQHQRR